MYVFGGSVAPSSGDQAGAESAGWVPIDRSWVYDPAVDHWNELSSMPSVRGADWAVSLGNKIYVIGGAQSNVCSSPTAPLRTNCSPMLTARNHFIAAAVNGKIYAIGRRLGSAMITSADYTDVVGEYDPITDQWTGKGRAPIRSSGMAGAEYQGNIYVAGGEFQDWEGAKALWAVERFEPSTGKRENLPRMRLAHHGFAAGFFGNALHVAGGGFQSDGMPGVNTETAVHEIVELDQ
jgi:hypothetical protein